MTEGKGLRHTPWWESELPVLRHELESYLRRRLPAWRADHDDLVNDALHALTREIRLRSSAFPTSWLEVDPPTIESERLHLHKLTMVILKRRVADLFRKRAPLSSVLVADEPFRDVADLDALTPERRILARSVLKVTLAVLSRMKPEDRDLIIFVAKRERDGMRKYLDASERQRLHRLRSTLKNEIVRRLGSGASGLFRNDDSADSRGISDGE